MTRLALLLVAVVAAAAACADAEPAAPTAPGLPAARWVAVELAIDYPDAVRLCALDDQGNIACALDGESLPSGAPQDDWIDIAINGSFVCALRADGQVLCYGQSDRADWREGYDPAPGETFTQIDGNWYGFCGLLEGGGLRCWTDRWYRLRTPGFILYALVAVGDSAVCGIWANGRPACQRNYEGFRGSAAAGVPQGRYVALDVASYGEGECVVNGAELCSEAPTCALNEAGEAYCWGMWTAEDWPPPPSGPFTAISAAPTYACALRSDGAAECWGEDAPSAPDEARFTALTAADRRTCGITVDAKILCWE